VACTEHQLEDHDGYLVVLSGDVPLLRGSTIADLLASAQREEADVAVLSMRVEEANRYGKIVRDAQGEVARVVEHKDATEAERAITEVNAGIYAFRATRLFEDLKRISNENAQGEYYLPDVIGLAVADGRRVIATMLAEPAEVMGVDTPEALERAREVHERRD
jgi:bifunctional UDP-N-acetylglucosamine pyrophosphorylase/glucosamine-1-phosphate N-acetyltransferase